MKSKEDKVKSLEQALTESSALAEKIYNDIMNGTNTRYENDEEAK